MFSDKHDISGNSTISIVHVYYGGDCDTVSIIYTSVVVTVIRYLTPLFCMVPPSCISLLLYPQ